MMDEFIHWPKPYHLSRNIIWMIKNWVKDHLISDSDCETVNIILQKLKRNDKQCWVNI